MAGNLLRTYAALLNKAKSTQKTASRYKAKTAFKLAAKLRLLHTVSENTHNFLTFNAFAKLIFLICFNIGTEIIALI